MKVFIETLGCPKNINDSQMAMSILEEAGHIDAISPEKADVIIVNTCGFINDAKIESIDKIFEMSKNEDATLIVSGCLSQRYADELFREIPEVDIFLGVNEYEKLPEILSNYKKGKREKHISLYEKEMKPRNRKIGEYDFSANIKISEGCDNHCTYCVIPSIRGGYRSRKIEDIVKEANYLAESGIKELILIGQDVTNYGIDIYGKYNLHELLRELVKIEKLKWIRLMYCYEDKITDELIKTIKKEDKICNYIDTPLQHISDDILKKMARKSTSSTIMNTISKLRREIEDISIRTTFIVGFPGESEEDFDKLYDFVSKSKLDRVGVFTYSQEENTPAAKMDNQVDEDIKIQRRDAIMNLQMGISNEKNLKFIGRIIEVVVEYEDEEGVYIGRSQYDAPEIDNAVVIKAKNKHKPGDFIKVEIYDAYDYDLVGREI